MLPNKWFAAWAGVSLPSDGRIPTRLEFAKQMHPGFTFDPWQVKLLETDSRRNLLNVFRQSGKSTIAAAVAAREARFFPGSLILLGAPALRQSRLLHRKIRRNLYHCRAKFVKDSMLETELDNGSEIISLPGKHETTRAFSAPRLILLDEASWLSDEFFSSMLPMLNFSERGGELWEMSTPYGKRGHFYDHWMGDGGWKKFKCKASECPRVPASAIEFARDNLTAARFAQDFECEFTETDDQVFREEDIQRAFAPVEELKL